MVKMPESFRRRQKETESFEMPAEEPEIVEMPEATQEEIESEEEVGIGSVGIEMMEESDVEKQLRETAEKLQSIKDQIGLLNEAWNKLVKENLVNYEEYVGLDPTEDMTEVIASASDEEKDALEKISKSSERRELANLVDQRDELQTLYDSLIQTQEIMRRDEEKQREAA